MRNFRLLRTISLIIIFCSIFLHSQPQYEATNSAPGEFSRIGFGARGIAMGNALVAVKGNHPVPYYNPALAGFQDGNFFTAGYTVLSLDRFVNYLSFGRRFEFYSSKDSNVAVRKPRAIAGFYIGLINAGVNNIDGRDNQGFKTETLNSSENLVFISLSNRFSEKVALGLNVKLYYNNLYEEVTATSLAFDAGILYNYSENLTLGLTLSDLNASYRWDTSPIYNQEGTITDVKFPTAKKIGAAYRILDKNILIAAEAEWNNLGRRLLRFGAEYEIYQNLEIRAGLDKIHLYNRDEYPFPSFGLSFLLPVNSFSAGFDYAFSYESYSLSSRHLVTLKVLF